MTYEPLVISFLKICFVCSDYNELSEYGILCVCKSKYINFNKMFIVIILRLSYFRSSVRPAFFLGFIKQISVCISVLECMLCTMYICIYLCNDLQSVFSQIIFINAVYTSRFSLLRRPVLQFCK
jgi:hypothetical protein